MNRTQYKAARRLLRDNGNYALRWLEPLDRQIFERLLSGKDQLAERADDLNWCKRECVPFNPRYSSFI